MGLEVATVVLMVVVNNLQARIGNLGNVILAIILRRGSGDVMEMLR